MILPIVAYGNSILKKEGINIDIKQSEIQKFIEDMFETMDHCNGVGLAAPQVNKSYKLFVIDSNKIDSDEDSRKSKDEVGVRKVFINPEIIEEFGNMVDYEEGCLSIPGVYGNVSRHSQLKMSYTDIDGTEKTETFSGFTARVIQHEYDHIMGQLFIEKLKPLKKQLIRKKLEDIKKGIVKSRYKMIFAN
jgi:peptide deformylase